MNRNVRCIQVVPMASEDFFDGLKIWSMVDYHEKNGNEISNDSYIAELPMLKTKFQNAGIIASDMNRSNVMQSNECNHYHKVW